MTTTESIAVGDVKLTFFLWGLCAHERLAMDSAALFEAMTKNPAIVRHWLVSTPSGQAIINDVLHDPQVVTPKELLGDETLLPSFESGLLERMAALGKGVPLPTNVIVELDYDGNVDVYAPRHCRVEFAQRPNTHGSKTLEVLAGELVEAGLSWRGRAEYYPGNLRGRTTHRKMSVSELYDLEINREAETKLVRHLSEIQGKNTPVENAPGYVLGEM